MVFWNFLEEIFKDSGIYKYHFQLSQGTWIFLKTHNVFSFVKKNEIPSSSKQRRVGQLVF